jgi:hypothetical protein
MTTRRGTSTGKTFFDWIQPSMAADGLIVSAPWQAEHAAVAAAEFTDPVLKQAAAVLAALHPHVLDYIGQAPVLVLAAAGEDRVDLRLRETRLKLASRFIAAGAFHRLPHILRAYGLVPPLRRLAGGPLKLAHHGLLPLLAAVPEARLAQVIPATAEQQRTWLQCLENLYQRRWARRASRDRFLVWTAANICTPEARRGAGDLADWAMFASERFDPAMTYEQARAASARWHEEHAAHRRSLAAVLAATAGAHTVDYAPLPAAIEVEGLHFRALCSAADLEDESARMHHCVRSYWRYVARGQSYIYSIRYGDARVATLELHRQRITRYTAAPLAIAQLKGPYNACPPEEVARATTRFVEIANACAIAAARAKAEAEKAAKARGVDSPRSASTRHRSPQGGTRPIYDPGRRGADR